MDEQAKIIISIVFGVIGILSSIVIICFIIWLIYRRKSKSRNLKKTSSISQQPQYQSSENSTSIKSNKNSRRKRNKRFNTNDSAISLSFNPPHLINQNVKNLDKLLSTDSISTTTPWPHEDAIPSTTNNDDRSATNPSNESFNISSSSESPSVSNIATTPQSYQQLNSLHFRFLNELNLVLSSKHDQKALNSLKYFQSSRQTNDGIPFDYNRSMTPSTITATNSSNYSKTSFNM